MAPTANKPNVDRALANPLAMRNVYSVIKYQQQMRNQNKQKGEQQKKQSEQVRDLWQKPLWLSTGKLSDECRSGAVTSGESITDLKCRSLKVIANCMKIYRKSFSLHLQLVAQSEDSSHMRRDCDSSVALIGNSNKKHRMYLWSGSVEGSVHAVFEWAALESSGKCILQASSAFIYLPNRLTEIQCAIQHTSLSHENTHSYSLSYTHTTTHTLTTETNWKSIKNIALHTLPALFSVSFFFFLFSAFFLFFADFDFGGHAGVWLISGGRHTGRQASRQARNVA